MLPSLRVAMWRDLLAGAAGSRISKCWKLSPEATESGLPAWRRYLGKAFPAFQLRREASHLFKIYRDLGDPPNIAAKDCPHGGVTAWELPEILREEFGIAYKRGQKLGLLVWQLNEGRVLWRDSHALFNLSNDAPFQIPQALHHLARLAREGTLDRQCVYRLQILGQCLESGQPTIRFWRNERLPLSADYLNEKPLLDKLREAIMLSEKVARVLQGGV